MQADASLSFLDGFVAEGLSQGAAPYKPHHQRQEEQLSQEKGILPSLYHESVCFGFSFCCYRAGCAYRVVQAGQEFQIKNPPVSVSVSVSRMLGLRSCATTPGEGWH